MIKFLRPRNQKEVPAVLIDAFIRIENYTRKIDSLLAENSLAHSGISADVALLKESVDEIKTMCENFEERISDLE